MTPKATKLPSGSWRCLVTVDGKRISVTRDTKKDAEKDAAALKLGFQKQSSSITLSKAYSGYIESKKEVLSPSTVAGYLRLSKNTFSAIMDVPLHSLNNNLIQREVSRMSSSGKSPKYIANAAGLLSAVLKMYSPDFQMVVTLPQRRPLEQRALTLQEQEKLISAIRGTQIELPVLMALTMGMRLSEIRGARYEDIKDGRLHICRAVVDDINGSPVEKGTKTLAGDRWVLIPECVSALLTETAGTIIHLSGQAIYKQLSRLCESAGIPHCRFHDLRHANAAAMIALGVDSKYAQQRNGWASDRMYKQVYGYTFAEKMEEAERSVNSHFDSIVKNIAHETHTKK